MILPNIGSQIMRKINQIEKSKFITIFNNIFENSSWIAEELYYLKPFENFDDLKSKMLSVFENTNYENQLKVIKNHPDLANKTKISNLSKESLNEQKKSQLDQCTDEEYKEFHHLNDKYKEKFGFPFILAVSGKSKIEILDIFRSRYLSDLNDELNQAKKQVLKIAELRLNEIKENY
ncbi:MAG: Uric acid degradation bifunctional protein [Alphaproteobacteria bacterium MarineAlpha5_Bin11]|nr:MAG: Uric acid degradation bifunctional protein [Alphaproteobacteria bacterium MarineAlpha5_Bin11]